MPDAKEVNRDADAQHHLLLRERLVTLGQLTATVSHELRNPLSVIHNAVYFLRRRLAGEGGLDAKTGEYLDIIESELAASNRIIDDLLSASRVQPPDYQRVDLDRLLYKVLSDIALPPRIRWRYRPAQTPFMLNTDPQLLCQVLRNLLVNAVQAISGEGEILLRAHVSRCGVDLQLSDSGEGISGEHGTRLFEPLFTTKPKGNGLGLWIARDMVRRLGGELSLVTGELPGACFCIQLPQDDGEERLP